MQLARRRVRFGEFALKQACSIDFSRLILFLAVSLVLALALPRPAAAQGTIPTIAITPTNVDAGGTIQVSLTDHTPGTFCVGLSGPGANYGLGIAPAYHLNLGQIVIGANGSGSASVTIPTGTANGAYGIVVGLCETRRPGLAPLTWDATAELVVGPPPPLTSAPHPGTTWYFAEGSTQPPFDTWLHLFNPSTTQTATVTVTFFTSSATPPITLVVPPVKRTSLYLNRILPPVAFGMRVDANLPVVAERSMFFRQDGTAVVGIPAPSPNWVLAEGSTQFPFDTWILLLNPNSATAAVKLQFLAQSGQQQVSTVVVPPRSRASVYANQVFPNQAFSTRISSDQPIVVERSMFKKTTGGGHAAPGVLYPQNAWSFAEGSTQPPFDTWYLVENPNPHPVRILMRFYLQAGGPGKLLDFTIPALSRYSIFANQVQPSTAGSATLISIGGPVVAERAMYFRNGAHDTIGTTQSARHWLFAEGSTQPPFDTWFLLVNSSAIGDAHVTVTYGLPNGQTVVQNLIVPGESRRSIYANLVVPNQPITTRIDSDLPIVVERSMYFSNGQGGTNTIGTQQDSP